MNKNTPNQKRRSRTGRDMAERVRASLWAQRVKAATGKSWEELDIEYVRRELKPSAGDATPDHNRVRVMHRIFRTGGSPEGVKSGGWGRVNLVEYIAEKNAAARPARDEYAHPLWSLLQMGEEPRNDVLEELSSRAVTRLGLMSVSEAVCQIGRRISGSTFPYRSDDLDVIKYCAVLLADAGSLDSLLVLACQARLAIKRLALEHAQAYLMGLHGAAATFSNKLGDEYIPHYIRGLIICRLLKNDWEPIHASYWTRADLVRDRAAEQLPHPRTERSSWEHSVYEMGPFKIIRGDELAGLPAVEATPQLQWFSDNHAKIYLAYWRSGMNEHGVVKGFEAPDDWQGLLEKARTLWGPPADDAEQVTFVDIDTHLEMKEAGLWP